MSSYITVSTKVGRKLVERARRLGINISKFMREKLEEEVRRRELENLKRRLSDMDDVLERINIERIVRSVREDREGR